MSTISSNGAGGGDFTATSSWLGGVVPAVGDTFKIVTDDTITDMGCSVINSGGVISVVASTGAILSREITSLLTAEESTKLLSLPSAAETAKQTLDQIIR